MMLGLALVVGSVGLLLGGTLYGRNAYHTTAETTNRKLDELKRVSVIIAVLEQPIQAEPTDVTSDLKLFQERTRLAVEFLKEYRKFHAETVTAGLDPDDGVMEAGLLDKLDTGLAHLEVFLTQYGGTGTVGPSAENPLPRNDPKVRKAYDATRLAAEELRVALIDDIKVSVERSNRLTRPNRWAIAAVAGWTIATVVALLALPRRAARTPSNGFQGTIEEQRSTTVCRTDAMSCGTGL
jgi:hypothetical protein